MEPPWRRTDHVIEYAGRLIRGVRTALDRAMERAGLIAKDERGNKISGRFIASHPLRKSAATWLAHNSVDMRRIQKLLGHEDIETTEQWYAGQLPGYTTAAVEMIEGTIGTNIFEKGAAATRAAIPVPKGSNE